MADDSPDFDSLFCRAIELPSAEERAAFIARSSGPNDGLRRRPRAAGRGPFSGR